jgi:hypothetical protein
MTTCRYFALCTNEAEGFVILPFGDIPTCGRCATKMEQTMTYTMAEVETAKDTIRREVMAKFGGMLGPALTGVEVGDEDAIRFLGGATVEELLA